MKAIIINPADEFVVESPVAGKTKKFLHTLIFKKKGPGFKWDKEKILDFIKSKFRIRKPIIKTTGNEIHATISNNKTRKTHKTPFHTAKGISAIVGQLEETTFTPRSDYEPKKKRESDSIESLLINPGRKPKITLKVIGKVKSLGSIGKTPKEINAILGELYGVKLHPSTIHKITKGEYHRKSISTPVSKEVTVKNNPMITEILENPSIISSALMNKALPLTSTRWFQSRLKSLAGKGLPATRIAEAMNEELIRNIPDKFWQRQSKVRIGKKGALGKGRIGKVITTAIVRRVGKKLLPNPWTLIDETKLRGPNKAAYERLGRNKKALYEWLQARMRKIAAKPKPKAYQAPATRKQMETFTPAGTRAIQAARIKKMQAGKKKKKSKSVSTDVLDLIGDNVMVGDLVGAMNPLDYAELPIEVDEVLNNPLFQKGTLTAALTKLGYQLPGVVAGAWALKLTGGLSGLITKLIPESLGIVRTILDNVISCGVVWAGAEVLLPAQYGVTANSIQTLALYKAASNILKFGKFEVVPAIGSDVGQFDYAEEDEEIEAEVSDELYDAWRRGEVTDEEIAQMIYTGKYAPYGIEPTAQEYEEEKAYTDDEIDDEEFEEFTEEELDDFDDEDLEIEEADEDEEEFD